MQGEDNIRNASNSKSTKNHSRDLSDTNIHKNIVSNIVDCYSKTKVARMLPASERCLQLWKCQQRERRKETHKYPSKL
jgi:hypothetical protein